MRYLMNKIYHFAVNQLDCPRDCRKSFTKEIFNGLGIVYIAFLSCLILLGMLLIF